MSVQVITTGDLRRTTNLPVNATGWAWGFWFRKTAAIGSGIFENLIEIGDASGNYLKLYLDGTAQDLRWQASGGTFEDVSLFTPTNGTWYFLCLRTASSTTGDILWRAATATSLTSSSGRNFGASTWTKMFFANNEGGLEPTANTEVAALKLFVGTLSDARVWEQSARLLPRCDPAILDSYLPLYTNSGNDEGGRARNWTVTATLTTVASSPNVARGGVGRVRTVRPAAASSLPVAMGLSSATGTAHALSMVAQQPVAAGLASGTGNAHALSIVAQQPVALGLASGVGTAHALSIVAGGSVAMQAAQGVGSAHALSIVAQQPVALALAAALGNVHALSIVAQQPVALGVAQASGQAHALTLPATVALAVATAQGFAHAPLISGGAPWAGSAGLSARRGLRGGGRRSGGGRN